MDFRLLGQVGLWVDGEEFPLGPPKQRLFLVLLLLGRGQWIPTEDLIDRVWEGAPPKRSRNVVATYASRLRTVLAHAVGDAAPIVHRSGTYTLTCERDAVDLFRFRDQVQKGRTAMATGDWQASFEAFDHALSLWRGSPLAGMRNGRLGSVIDALDQERRDAEVARAQALMLSGEHERAVRYLQWLRARHPLDEEVIDLLMRSLDATGRTASAIDLYNSLRRRLAHSMGIEPSRILQQGFVRLLRGHPSTRDLPGNGASS